jgi:transcriptional regulator with XRE-family HTH domain
MKTTRKTAARQSDRARPRARASGLSPLDFTSFHAWFVYELEHQNLTQRALARMTGLSKQYINDLYLNRPHSETGVTIQPSRASVDLIADAFGADRVAARELAGYAPLSPAERRAGK